MRKYLLAAVTAAVLTTPAFAQDAGPYVGIEGGILMPRDTNLDIDVDFVDPAVPDTGFPNAVDLDFKRGYDVDAIAGFDLGMFRVEGELGYKRAKVDSLEFDEDFVDAYDDATGVNLDDAEADLDGRVSVLSGMVNALVDLDAGGARVYGGGGVGRARVKFGGDKDSAWAYQLIAGVGVPLSQNVEAGLKYRYFRTAKLDFSDNANFTEADVLFTNDSRFQSHSLLASLIFNFGRSAPAPMAPIAAPPPPAPITPAMQTCPDGSVILATDYCPVASPPPPPPVYPQGERG